MKKLKQWIKSQHGRGAALSRHLRVPPSFVVKMAHGRKPVPVEHAAQIEVFTCGQVSRRDLFPDDFVRIWPELAGTTLAATTALAPTGCATPSEQCAGP